MGKKRIAIVGEPPRSLVKSGKEHGRITDVGTEALAEAAVIEEKTKKLEAEIAAKTKKAPKASLRPSGFGGARRGKPTRQRSKKYQEAQKKVDSNKFYPLVDAIKLLKKVSISQFNGSVDIHLVVRKEGLKGEVEFPHPTGKTQKIRIADEELLKELEKGKIDFTGLVATPAMMPRLAKYAKILGPRGLMPNPKAGTITDKPEELVKKLGGKTTFKTEIKAPLIHISIGRVNSPEKDLQENFKALIESVGRKNIQKAVISPTMGPGIKVDLNSI